MSELKIITNHNKRDLLSFYELTEKELKEFDYYSKEELEECFNIFFRYKSNVYDITQFMHCRNLPNCNPISKWDGIHNDTFFSGIVIKLFPDEESVIVGAFYS